MQTRLDIQVTERQARLIELLIERSELNSPMNDAEFSSAREIERAIRIARAQEIGLEVR